MTAQAVTLPITPPSIIPGFQRPSGTARGRIWCYHGLNGHPSTFFSSAPFDSLLSGLLADGWQVVIPGEMYSGASQATSSQSVFTGDGTKGASFRAAVLALHLQTKKYVDAVHGPPPGSLDVLLGISWGGLMVELLAGSGVPFRALLSHVAASNPSYMTEFSGDDLTSLQPSPRALPNRRPVWISYSTSDTRVGYADTAGGIGTKTIADTWAAVNPIVTVRGGAGDSYYIGLGHSTDATVVSHLLAWIAALP